MRYWLSYQIGRNARYLRPRRSEVKGGEKILFYTLNVMHRRMRHPWFLIRDQLRLSHLEELVRNVFFSLRSLCRKKERNLLHKCRHAYKYKKQEQYLHDYAII